MHKYAITIYWSDEDNLFVADIPELSGCSAHGDSYEDALAEAQAAISLWNETTQELGRQTPTPTTRSSG